METESIELLPAGLVTCIVNDIEVRITKISPRGLIFRCLDEVSEIQKLIICFYIFKEYRYEEIEIEKFSIKSINKNQYYCNYELTINDDKYLKSVRNSFIDYQRYIMSKAYGDENEFSEMMVNYPYEKDYDFCKNYKEQKKEWLSNLNYSKDLKRLEEIEFAINLDNYDLYFKYLDSKNIDEFKKNYLSENFVSEHNLFTNKITRLYIGNEFCHNLFPDLKLLLEMLNRAKKEKLEITLAFTYMRECNIENIDKIINSVYDWCKENNYSIELIINDWGMIELIKDKLNYFKMNLGVLLNKRKKDPRYKYKKGYEENRELMAENSLNADFFNDYLKEIGFSRFEFESCGYKILIPSGKHSLHLPFYQTNTSQFCTLYAKCTTMDRGKQKLVNHCPKYCSEYVFAYPKHLKMIGRYNSLFSFDNIILENSEILEEYIENGIDRIVLNFI